MDSIKQGFGFGYNCLSGMLFRQNPDEVKEREVCGVSYEVVTVSFLIGTIGLYALNRLVNAKYKPVEDTPELFWKELEGNQRPSITGPIYVLGRQIADDLPSIQKEMFLNSNAMSHLFFEYLEEGLKPKTVLDLGCGIGANTIPLLKHGVCVKAIDNKEYLLDAYGKNIKNKKDRQFVSLKCADLTTLDKYTEEANTADVVLATDVFPYIPILCWKSTMEKIVFSLKPGGYLFGTLFVKKAWFNSPVINVHEMFGAQYYVIANLAERLVKHSGLEMIKCRPRESGHGVYEFVARKPVVGVEEVFFEDLRDGKSFVMEDDEVLMRQFLQSLGDKRGF